jgi:Fe-S oxidoreductase
VKLVEMERIREFAWCCGAGGGVSEAYPEHSLWTAGERIEEAVSTGAEAIVTSCPWCVENFSRVVEQKGENLQVFDIIDLIARAV